MPQRCSKNNAVRETRIRKGLHPEQTPPHSRGHSAETPLTARPRPLDTGQVSREKGLKRWGLCEEGALETNPKLRNRTGRDWAEEGLSVPRKDSFFPWKGLECTGTSELAFLKQDTRLLPCLSTPRWMWATLCCWRQFRKENR